MKTKEASGQQGLEAQINKGLTKHQALNAVQGAGSVKIKKGGK